MIGCFPTQALTFLAVFFYATQAIAFEWKPGFSQCQIIRACLNNRRPCSDFTDMLRCLINFRIIIIISA